MNEIARAGQLASPQPALSHPDPQVSRRLPYHFAKAKGVIAVRQQGEFIELWVRDDLESSALAETRRILRQPVRPLVLDKDRFEQSLAQV